jgi:hypothetical protein
MGGDNLVHDLLLLWAVIDLCDIFKDLDYPTWTPRKLFGAGAGVGIFGGAVASGGGGMLPGDLAAAGMLSNLGKIGDAGLL